MAVNKEYMVWNTISGDLDCLHCGDTFPISKILPCAIPYVSALSKVFDKLHRSCRTTSAGDELKERNAKAFEAWKLKNPEIKNDDQK